AVGASTSAADASLDGAAAFAGASSSTGPKGISPDGGIDSVSPTQAEGASTVSAEFTVSADAFFVGYSSNDARPRRVDGPGIVRRYEPDQDLLELVTMLAPILNSIGARAW